MDKYIFNETKYMDKFPWIVDEIIDKLEAYIRTESKNGSIANVRNFINYVLSYIFF